jgi:hypothetical protein
MKDGRLVFWGVGVHNCTLGCKHLHGISAGLNHLASGGHSPFQLQLVQLKAKTSACHEPGHHNSQQAHVETLFHFPFRFPKQINEHFDGSFPPTSCFIAFSGASQRCDFKGATKNVLQKRPRYKKNRQKSKTKTDFFSVLVFAFLGVSR